MRIRDLLALIAVCAVWGVNFVVAKFSITGSPGWVPGFEGSPPLFFAFLRFALLFAILSPWLRPRPQDMKAMIGIALSMGALQYALMFLGLSVDEATGVHEVAIEPLRDGLGLSGFLYFGWVIPGMALVALVGLAYLPFLFAQPGRTRLVFFLAGLLYVGGALGMELVGGKMLTLYGEESLAYRVAFSTEETMEILGATLFVAGLLGHLKRRFGGAVLVIA